MFTTGTINILYTQRIHDILFSKLRVIAGIGSAPPYGHAERSSLKILARRTGLGLAEIKKVLEGAGLTFEGEEQTVLDVAKANNLTPKEVWLVMQKAKPAEVAGVKKPFPETPFPGFGRQKFQEMCDAYGIDSKTIVLAFEKKGISVDVTLTLKEIANANNTDPHSLFEIIHGLVYGN